MTLEGDDFNSRAWALGFGFALMMASGYYGELVVTGDLTPRWVCWFASMSFFLYIVYELLVGLAAATASEPNPEIAKMIGTAEVMAVISCCTYPIVYLLRMLAFSAAKAIASIQMGYCACDIALDRDSVGDGIGEKRRQHMSMKYLDAMASLLLRATARQGGFLASPSCFFFLYIVHEFLVDGGYCSWIGC